MENSNTPPPSALPDNGKTVAIVSYITLIGWIVALIIHSDRKTRLGAYHLRQTLGLMILAIAIYILSFPLAMVPYMGWILSLTLNFGILAMWLMGIIAAAGGQEKPVPIVGGLFQKWFAGFGL